MIAKKFIYEGMNRKENHNFIPWAGIFTKYAVKLSDNLYLPLVELSF